MPFICECNASGNTSDFQSEIAGSIPATRTVFYPIVLQRTAKMAASFNSVIIIGNITRDIELRYTPSGTAVADVGIAINEKRKNAAGELVEETTFVEVTMWGRTAEVTAEYCKKGSTILVSGRLKLDTWEQDGVKRSKIKIVADKMQLLGGKGKPESDSDTSTAPPSSNGGAKSESNDQDIPF